MPNTEATWAVVTAAVTGAALAWIVGRVYELRLERRIWLERAKNAELQELISETNAELRRAINRERNKPNDSWWRIEP